MSGFFFLNSLSVVQLSSVPYPLPIRVLFIHVEVVNGITMKKKTRRSLQQRLQHAHYTSEWRCIFIALKTLRVCSISSCTLSLFFFETIEREMSC